MWDLIILNPLGTKILMAKGSIVRCGNFNSGGLIGCTLTAVIKLPDARGFTLKHDNYGCHLVVVYGDYTKEMGHLANLLNIGIEYHNA